MDGPNPGAETRKKGSLRLFSSLQIQFSPRKHLRDRVKE